MGFDSLRCDLAHGRGPKEGRAHEHNRTLLLTQGYEPSDHLVAAAITLLALAKVDVVEEYNAEIGAVSIVVRVPAVVRLRKAFRRTPSR